MTSEEGGSTALNSIQPSACVHVCWLAGYTFSLFVCFNHKYNFLLGQPLHDGKLKNVCYRLLFVEVATAAAALNKGDFCLYTGMFC